jgi:hypothetical protein
MGNRFDQLGKKIGLRALGPSGITVAQDEIPSNAHHADLRHEPDPAREAERARLGLLGRIVSILCLIEIFSGTPDEEETLACLGKLIAFRQQRSREANQRRRKQGRLQTVTPAPPLVKPFLWIIAAGRPSGVLALLGAIPAQGWPPGVYVSPGGPLDACARPTSLRDGGGLLRIGIIVASELPRERSTILVRIMAGGAALPGALAELGTLPPHAHERDVASMDLLELRRALGSKPHRTTEEEDFIVSTQNIVEELRDEGRDEGRLTQARVSLRRVLAVRNLAPSPTDEASIDACTDIATLERWLDQALIARSAAEALRSIERTKGQRRRAARSS